VERANLAEIDIKSGEIVKRHSVPKPGFLNDIAADSEGNIYVSDGQRGQILKFSSGQFSVWKSGDEFIQVNGLHYSDGKLYAGFSSDASLRSIDLSSGEVTTIAKLDPGAVVDGIEKREYPCLRFQRQNLFSESGRPKISSSGFNRAQTVLCQFRLYPWKKPADYPHSVRQPYHRF
jgi:hypothetical protein